MAKAAGYPQLAVFCGDAERENKQLDQRACNPGAGRLYCRSITVACINCERTFIASEKTSRRELHVLPCGSKRLGEGGGDEVATEELNMTTACHPTMVGAINKEKRGRSQCLLLAGLMPMMSS
jgi:hypothetical protein